MSKNQVSDEIQPKYYNDDKTKLICQYCLAEMKMITPSHLKFHDMSMTDYKEKFPDAPLRIKSKKLPKTSKENIDITNKTFVKLGESTNPINVIFKKETETTEKSYPINDFSDDDKILTKDRIFNAVKKVYPLIKRNHIFKKTNIDGNILYTVMTDFGDPSKRVMIDFSGMAWHIKTPLLTKYRKKDLLSESKWKYVLIEEDSLTTNEIINILKSK